MTLIAIHLLQNHAPSNLNRDENGDPKDSIFGGARRARISSQALKRSVRKSEEFRAVVDPALIGDRTQLLPTWIRDELAAFNVSDEERAAILQHAVRFGKGDKRPAATPSDEGDGDEASAKGRGKGKGAAAATSNAEETLKTAQLMFLTRREVQTLTARLVEKCREIGPTAFAALDTEKDIVQVFNKKYGELEPHAVDIAMFGRMTTSSPFKNIEAAVQVAPALSTHKIEPEFDFYTAVDDVSGETGAGFLGDTAFNSATYYKYFNIHWEGLLANLHDDQAVAATAVQALLRAAMTAIPTGKQNSFAAHNLPDFALIEVLPKNIPLSYANAFLKPVRAVDGESLMESSIKALTAYAEKLPAKYNLDVDRAVFAIPSYALADATECADLNELVAWLQAHLPQTAEA
ncbi:MAG TPA: type I-E CRISPR-associated protein Cas7/Cse4/CasC [Herpetosiphonaceae bacterium]